MIVSRNDDKGDSLLFVSLENRSIVARCIGQLWVSSGNCVHYISYMHMRDCVFDVEDTELIVTHVQGNKL